MYNEKKRSRLHIRSIKDAVENADHLPADEEIAELFREMRQATGQSPGQIADELGTTVEIVELLEQGRLFLLPPWTETSRIIRAYTALLGLDADPVMRRIMLQLPGDHPKRPRTQEIDPSYINLQANAEAVMNRIPVNQTAVEAPFVPMAPVLPSFVQRQDGVDAQETREHFSPEYAQMRAIPPDQGGSVQKSRTQDIAKSPRKGVFVALVQLLLLLIMLAGGYAVWLAINDPQGYEHLKTGVLTMADAWYKSLMVYLQDLTS